MGNSLRVTPLTMYQIDNTCYDGLKECLPQRPTNNRGYNDLLLEGFDIDEDVFINNMLAELAEMQIIYTQPDFFKFAVTNWALKEKDIWQRLYDTVFFKYNPIWNKDGTIKDTGKTERDLTNETNGETEKENTVTSEGENTGNNTRHENNHTFNQRDGEEKKTGEDTESQTPDLIDTLTITYNSKTEHNNDNTTTGQKTTQEIVTPRDSETTENSVSAYNDSGYNARDKSVTTKDGTVDTTTTESYNNFKVNDDGDEIHSGSDTHTTTKKGTDQNKIIYDNKVTTGYDDTTDTDIWETNDSKDITKNKVTETGKDTSGVTTRDTGTIDNTNTRIEQGNIGVTTTQQMIEAERQLVKFNIYDLIIDSFKQRFCLLLY